MAEITNIVKSGKDKYSVYIDNEFSCFLTSETIVKNSFKIGQFIDQSQIETAQFENEKLLYKIFSFVETNFINDCSLSSLSKETGYDYAYLSRYFKRATGLSFNSYATHFRLSHACYLMENTTQTILQCAYNSGFSSLRNFNRCFKEYLGITPTQYLKTIKFMTLEK